ncbi:MAG: MCE family protein [Rhodocyclaceae bacterium]|jgi:phospholipid/cholesterol/gamma-HCH transport system substrate-binding protein|nr:MCE family protein [Rhodocyclaceae bacterium]
MESRAHALAAGIFMLLLGVAALLAGWWLSGKREATNEYVLVTQKSVVGLNPQAQVRFRGIRAGKVLDIDLDPKDPRSILIRINVDADMPVTRGTTARLNYQGVTGLAYVLLEDAGESREPLVGEGGEPPRIALKTSAMDSLGDAAADLMAQMRQVAERTNAVLSEQNVKRISQTLANLETASAGLGGTLKDASQAMAGLKRALNEENLKRISATLAHLEKAGGEAAPLAADLRTLVGTLQGLGKKLDAFSSEAGTEVVHTTLPRMNLLLQELAVNSRQMSRILDQIEESPNMLIFGRAGQRPGPGEAGFSRQ